MNSVDRNPQFLGGSLGEFGTRPLTSFNFSGHHSDRAVTGDMDARSDIPDSRVPPSPAPLLLSQRRGEVDGNEQSGAKELDE